MGKSNWVCANCGMHSSRKHNVKRHIENLHGENGAIVSFMDYVIGRRSGFYYPSAPPTYVKKNSSTTVFDTFKEELPKAFLKELISHQFAERPQYQYQGSQLQYQNFLYQIQHIAAYRLQNIFGLRAIVCDKCMVTEIIEVYYDVRGLKQREHVCKAEWVSEFAKLSDSEREARKKWFTSQIPNTLKMALSGWKLDNKYALEAINVPSNMKSDGFIRIVVNNEVQPKTITTPYLDKDTIRVEASDEAQWTRRAISEKITYVDEDELDDFLSSTKSATFGFFKVNGAQLFLLTLIKLLYSYRYP